MARLLIAFLLLTPTIALGQESDDYKIFVFESNLPDELNHKSILPGEILMETKSKIMHSTLSNERRTRKES